MSSLKVGVIGVGVMGEAIVNGAMNAGFLKPADMFVYDVDRSKSMALADRHSVNSCVSMEDLADKSDLVILAVKPVVCKSVVDGIAQKLADKALISIVAGWNSLKFSKILKKDTRLLCVMPNTPAVCGEGMSVLSANNTLLPDELQFASQLFASFGEVEIIDEKYFDIVTGISGSGPAYVFMFIEALMSAGIYNGLPARTARKLAAQTVLGAAKALKGNDRHPAELRDAVCTPAGTTIEAVYDLERNGFSGIVMSAVDKCAKKYKQMTNDAI